MIRRLLIPTMTEVTMYRRNTILPSLVAYKIEFLMFSLVTPIEAAAVDVG